MEEDPEIDGYDPDLFIDPYDKDYLCPICVCVVRDPVTLPAPCDCIGKVYCYTCIARLQEFRCPLCRAQFTLPQCEKNKFVRGKVEALRIRCHHHKEGCDAFFIIGKDEKNLKQHKEICDSEKILCKECTQKILRGEMKKHQSQECIMRTVACDKCKELFRAHELQEHQRAMFGCANLTTCRHGCVLGLIPFPKADLKKHTSECPLEDIECELCGFRCPRGELMNHQRDNLTKHYTILNQRLALVTEANKRLESENKQVQSLKEEVVQLRMENKLLKKEVKTLQEQMSYHPSSTKRGTRRSAPSSPIKEPLERTPTSPSSRIPPSTTTALTSSSSSSASSSEISEVVFSTLTTASEEGSGGGSSSGSSSGGNGSGSDDDSDSETAEGKRLLSRTEGKGFQIRARYSKNDEGIMMHFCFDNWSQLALNTWRIKFRANYLGVAPKHQLAVETIHPGGIATYSLPLVVTEGQTDFTREDVEMAIKNELGIFPFKDKISPRYLFDSKMSMESERFLKLWKDVGESKQLVKNFPTSLSSDHLRDRLIAGGLRLIASRTKATGKVVYFYIRYREVDVLIELLHKMSSKSSDITLRTSEAQGHLTVVLKYIAELLSNS